MDKWIELIRQKLSAWATEFVRLLPNLVIAILVFIIFFFLAKLARRFSQKLMLKISRRPVISGLMATVVYIIILMMGLFISLELMHLDKAVTTLLAGAGVIGLALGFAFQDLTANFISGVFIIFRKPFDAGHVVETNGFTGTIELIQLRSTTIKTMQGLQVILPNKDIFQKPITNYTLSERRRIDLVFTLPVKANTKEMLDRIRAAVGDVSELDRDAPTEIHFTEIAGDNIKLEIWCWVKNTMPESFYRARNEVIQKMQTVLAADNKP